MKCLPIEFFEEKIQIEACARARQNGSLMKK